MNDFIDCAVAPIAITLITVFAGFLALLCSMVPINYISCKNYMEATNRPTKFYIVSGCYVQDKNNDWYTLKEYEKSIIAKQGLNRND